MRGVRRTAGVRRDVEHKISDKVRSNRQRHEHSEDERLDRVRTHARREPGVTGVAQAALRRVKRGLALHVELSGERRELTVLRRRALAQADYALQVRRLIEYVRHAFFALRTRVSPARTSVRARDFFAILCRFRPPNAHFSVRTGVSQARTPPPAPVFRPNAPLRFSRRTCTPGVTDTTSVPTPHPHPPCEPF